MAQVKRYCRPFKQHVDEFIIGIVGSWNFPCSFRSTRHRELLSWMVDQMRLDQVPANSSSLASNTESANLDRESGPPILRIPEFSLTRRRNIENPGSIETGRIEFSSASASPAANSTPSTAPQLTPAGRVLMPGVSPLPPIVQQRMQATQRDQVPLWENSSALEDLAWIWPKLRLIHSYSFKLTGKGDPGTSGL